MLPLNADLWNRDEFMVEVLKKILPLQAFLKKLDYMKRGILFLLVATLLVACDPENNVKTVINDFEDVLLTELGYFDGSDKSGSLNDEGVYVTSIVTGSLQLINRYTYDEEYGYGFWEGFAISALTDSETPGFENQFSTVAGRSAASPSSQFAVAYDSAIVELLPYKHSVQKLQSVKLTNSTYTYHELKEGGPYSKKFDTDDWFKVIIKGYHNEIETGVVEFYLADFREGQSVIVREWTTVSLEALGEVDKLVFTFDSSDKGDFGINTPKYVCVDDLIVTVEECSSCNKN